MECERLSGCPFFKNLKHLPRTADQLVASYCYGDSTSCARLQVVSAGIRPPDDLFPNETNRAFNIIAKSTASPNSFR
jgi:hypothetical protein